MHNKTQESYPISNMLKKFKQLSQREQYLITGASGLILMCLLYFQIEKVPNIFSPSIRPKVMEDTRGIEKLLPDIEKLKQLKKQVSNYQKIPTGSLFDFIDKNPPKLELLPNEKPVYINQAEGKEILVKSSGVGFDSLVKWLAELNQKYGVIVSKALFYPVDEKQGFVSAEVLLSQGNQ